MEDLEVYQNLKANNHPAKMLAIAEHWLRAEMEAKKAKKMKEKALGVNSHLSDVIDRTQGGYSSGRMQTDEEIQEKLKRQGRLSDLMGNAGGIHKVHRVAAGESN